MLTDAELDVLLEYIDFMEEFDDDPTFRDHALSARPKLANMKLQNTSSNSDYAKCLELLNELMKKCKEQDALLKEQSILINKHFA